MSTTGLHTYALGEPVEFPVRRIESLRVIFSSWEEALIQIVSEGRPLNIRGSEHDLWVLARQFTAETQDAFADQALDRARMSAHRAEAQQEETARLREDLRRRERMLTAEAGMREVLEAHLTKRDGFNRTQALLQKIRAASPELYEAGQS